MPSGTFGNAKRNDLRGPELAGASTCSLQKRLQRWAAANLDLRWDVFNVFNTVNLGLPNADIASATVGTISQLAGRPAADAVLGSAEVLALSRGSGGRLKSPPGRTAKMAQDMAEPLALEREEAFWAGLENARRFFMGEADVHRALERLARTLDEQGIPYAVIGALALNEWGYRRVTVDVDVLLTPEGLAALRQAVLGRGYIEKFPGSRGLRDTEAGVTVDVVLAGEYPGDGKPKPVVFPDPAQAAVRGRRVALLPLQKLIELKLASGLSAPHRLKDLADVLELIRALGLPARQGGRPRRLRACEVRGALAGSADRRHRVAERGGAASQRCAYTAPCAFTYSE